MDVIKETLAELSPEAKDAILRALIAENTAKAKDVAKELDEAAKEREKTVLTSLAEKWNRHVDAFYASLTEEERQFAPDVEYHHAEGRKVIFRKGARGGRPRKETAPAAPAVPAVKTVDETV